MLRRGERRRRIMARWYAMHRQSGTSPLRPGLLAFEGALARMFDVPVSLIVHPRDVQPRSWYELRAERRRVAVLRRYQWLWP